MNSRLGKPAAAAASAILLAMALSGCRLFGGGSDAPLVFGTQLPPPTTDAAAASADPAQPTEPAAAPAADAAAPAPAPEPPLPPMSIDEIATAYVGLVLSLGEVDEGYVDAYYGPPEWREQAKARHLDATQVESESQRLIARLIDTPAQEVPGDPLLGALRKSYLKNQLGALSARAAMLHGRKFSFDDEARALYDVNAPHYDEADFEPALKALDELLPKGPGTLSERYNRYIERFAVPKDKLQGVMRAAIGYAQLHVHAHVQLPPGEHFELELVGDKPWSAYNWYQGNYTSLIQVNADQPVSILRIVQLASHEGYPGHHVYNCLLEQNLVHGRNWPEYQVYPLYSPQSFIAEGSADYGIELTFPGQQRLNFERELFDLAGFDPAQLDTYDRVMRAAKTLGPATIEAARRYLDGSADAAATEQFLQHYTLASPERAHQRIAFFDKYRSYIINYSYGESLVGDYVEHEGGSEAGSDAQWHAYLRLLSTPRVPTTMSETPPHP